MEKRAFIIEMLTKKKTTPFSLLVNGNSMAPNINNNDRILVEPYFGTTLKRGTIIVYRKFNDHLTVHRIMNVVKISKKRFFCETKGDNNSEIDPYKVFNHEIIGIVKERNFENEYD